MECSGDIPETKRSDAIYCSVACCQRAGTRAYKRRHGAKPRAGSTHCLFCGQSLDRPREKYKHSTRKFCDPQCSQKYTDQNRTPEWRRSAMLKKNYGITAEQFDRMLAEQGGCAICGTTDPNGYNWHVDHDHGCCPGSKTCGQCIRGILCHSCNTGLGVFGDDADRLGAASDYLRRARSSVRAVS